MLKFYEFFKSFWKISTKFNLNVLLPENRVLIQNASLVLPTGQKKEELCNIGQTKLNQKPEVPSSKTQLGRNAH